MRRVQIPALIKVIGKEAKMNKKISGRIKN